MNNSAESIWKEYQKAMADIDNAVKLIPKERSVFINRAWLLWCMGNPQQGIEDMLNAELIKPTESIRYFDFTSMHQQLAYWRQSANDLEKEIAVLPQNWASRFNRALIHERQGNYQRAIDDLSAVISINGEIREAYLHRASINVKCKTYANAACDYFWATVLFIKSNPLWLSLLFIKVRQVVR